MKVTPFYLSKCKKKKKSEMLFKENDVSWEQPDFKIAKNY